MKIRMDFAEIKELLGSPSPAFPRYVSQIINLANQNAQGTRPKVVGQMSELIQEFREEKGKFLNEWSEWYLSGHPDAIDMATGKIMDMVGNLQEAILAIDREMVRNWVKDLVVVKTFIGLMFQEAILKRVSAELKTTYRLADPDEEAQGIDGFIGDLPVSIKPMTYNIKQSLPENIEVAFIFYEKRKSGIAISFDW